MPSVWPDKKGNRWRLKWLDPVTGKGRTFSPKIPYPSKAAAIAAARAFAKKLPDVVKTPRHAGGVRPEAQHTIIQICDTWLTTETRPTLSYSAEAAASVKAASSKMKWEYPQDVTRQSLLRWNGGSNKTKSYCKTIFSWAVATLKQPFEEEALNAMKGLQSLESEWDLLTEDQYQKTMDKAKAIGQEHLAHCLSVYGWRPVTACRIKCSDFNFDATPPTVKLDVKRTRLATRKKKPHVHPLFPETVALLRPLVDQIAAKHGPDAPAFRNRQDVPWHYDGHRAIGIRRWYCKFIRPIARDRGAAYAWKRWALTAMEDGRAPWPRPLSDREIMLFTGHTTTSQVKRYKRTNQELAASLVNNSKTGSPGGGTRGANCATTLSIVQLNEATNDTIA